MFLGHGILIKKGKPFETPSLFKSIFLPFLNRCSSPARLSSFFSIFYTKNISLRLCRPALFCENYLDTSFCMTYSASLTLTYIGGPHENANDAVSGE